MTRVSAPAPPPRAGARAPHDGAAFVIERHGKAVAEIRRPRAGSTVADLRALLSEAPPDRRWTSDLEGVVADRKAMAPRDRWAA